MKKYKKFLKIGFWVIVILFGILFVIGMLMPSNIKVKGSDDGKMDDVSFFSDNYITDENYEPEEKDLLGHAVTTLNHLDLHEWNAVDDSFQSDFVEETSLIDVYDVMKTDPEKIDTINYTVENKSFTAYLNEEEVQPIELDKSNGVEWATYPYDVWINFSFTLTRVIKMDNGETKKDTFDVKGNYPPLWLPDISETHWALGSLMLRQAEAPE